MQQAASPAWLSCPRGSARRWMLILGEGLAAGLGLQGGAPGLGWNSASLWVPLWDPWASAPAGIGAGVGQVGGAAPEESEGSERLGWGRKGGSRAWKVEVEAALWKGERGLAGTLWGALGWEPLCPGSFLPRLQVPHLTGASSRPRRWVGIPILMGSSCMGTCPGVSGGDSLPTEATSPSDWTPGGPQPAWKCIQT